MVALYQIGVNMRFDEFARLDPSTIGDINNFRSPSSRTSAPNRISADRGSRASEPETRQSISGVIDYSRTPDRDPRRNNQGAATGLTAGPPYPRGSIETAVKAMQGKLLALGYSLGDPKDDGKYGPRTERAVKAYKKDFNIEDRDSGRTMSAAELEALKTATPKENPSPTGNERGSSTTRDRHNTPTTGARAAGEQPGRLEGTNVLALNPDPNEIPNQTIISALDRAASALGIKVQITPQGGRRSRQAGTLNHPTGEAADIQIVKGGTIVRPSQDPDLYDSLIQKLVFNAARRGVRPGIGGYNWGIHYDESNWRQSGRGIAGTWGSDFVQRGIRAASRELAA